MVLKRGSDGPVTVALLVERQVALDWQEAVAVVLEVGEAFERSGKSGMPRHQSLVLTPSGTVEFLRGRTRSGDAAAALALTLSVLLPEDRPTQLRLLVSTTGQGAAAHKSVGEFIEALRYFECPDRRNLLSGVHHRALETPVPTTSSQNERSTKGSPKKKRSRRRVLVPLAVTVLLLVVAGAVVLMEQRQPGSVSGQAVSLQELASGVWGTALESTAELREGAAADLSTVVEHMREVAAERFGDGTDADGTAASEEANAERTTSAARRSGTAPPGRVPADAAAREQDRDLPVTSADKALGEETGEEVSADAVESEPKMPPDPLLASVLFDRNDVNVTPPVTLRHGLPTVVEDIPWNADAGVVEAIVSTTGKVERVKLLPPPHSIHQSMSLSAIKTWRFRPAAKDGHPVRYRLRLPLVDKPR